MLHTCCVDIVCIADGCSGKYEQIVHTNPLHLMLCYCWQHYVSDSVHLLQCLSTCPVETGNTWSQLLPNQAVRCFSYSIIAVR
jgi:hypothetical protein